MGIFEDTTNITNPKNYGYRIYHLIKGGPLDKNNLHEISDFIIPPESVINGQTKFNDWVKSFAGRKSLIKIFSLLDDDFKEIEITANPEGSKDGILGASVKLENFVTAERNLLHVISVKKDSFAETQLKLKEDEDYIIAVKPKDNPIITLNKDQFNPLEILSVIVEQKKGIPLEFFIFNNKCEARKVEVNIDPNNKDFSLGCDCAYGPIHEFPKKSKQQRKNEVKNFEDRII